MISHEAEQTKTLRNIEKLLQQILETLESDQKPKSRRNTKKTKDTVGSRNVRTCQGSK